MKSCVDSSAACVTERTDWLLTYGAPRARLPIVNTPRGGPLGLRANPRNLIRLIPA